MHRRRRLPQQLPRQPARRLCPRFPATVRVVMMPQHLPHRPLHQPKHDESEQHRVHSQEQEAVAAVVRSIAEGVGGQALVFA